MISMLLYSTEFWSSHLNVRGPRNEPPAADKLLPPAPSPEDCSTPINPNPTPFQELCPIQTRSPCELNYGGGKGLCFVNPLFLQDYPGRNAMRRRYHFKTSVKVRVSTENSSSLSPPVTPPPPPPLLAKAKCKARLKAAKQMTPPDVVEPGEEAVKKTVQEDTDYMQPCVVSQKKSMVTPTLSPTAEDDYQMPKALQKVLILFRADFTGHFSLVYVFHDFLFVLLGPADNPGAERTGGR